MANERLGDLQALPQGSSPDEQWHVCDGSTLESLRYPDFREAMGIRGPVFVLPDLPNQQIFLGKEVEPPAPPAPRFEAVPRQSVHRFWQGTKRSGDDWVRTVVSSTQGDEPHDWDLDSLPADAEWVRAQTDPRGRSNALRYWLLFTYGGLWLDHDVIPLTNLRTNPFPWTAAYGSQREASTMWFPQPSHPMLGELVQACRDAQDGDKLGAPLLTKIGVKYPGVRLEPRALPLDSAGRATPGLDDPMAVHLWQTSRDS